MKRFLFILAAATLSGVTYAQAPSQLDWRSIEAESSRAQEQNRKAIEQLAPSGQGINTQVQKQLDSNAATTRAIGNLPGVNQSLSSTATQDFLGAIGQNKPTQGQQVPRGDLILFVSMSMPPAMIRAYTEQARRFGATIVMRGLVDNKMSSTRQRLADLNPGEAGWQINPEAFTKFKVNKVPTIVLATAESASVMEDGCAPPGTYASISGDIQIAAALDRFALRAQPEVASLARLIIAADRAAGAPGRIR